MGIKMMPEQFSEHRRRGPQARPREARVFDALQDHRAQRTTACTSSATRREGQTGRLCTLWGAPDLARFAVQVKGGQYMT